MLCRQTGGDADLNNNMHYFSYEEYKQAARALYVILFYFYGMRDLGALYLDDRYKKLPGPVFAGIRIRGIACLLCGVVLTLALLFASRNVYYIAVLAAAAVIVACGLYVRFMKRRFPFKLDSDTKD